MIGDRLRAKFMPRARLSPRVRSFCGSDFEARHPHRGKRHLAPNAGRADRFVMDHLDLAASPQVSAVRVRASDTERRLEQLVGVQDPGVDEGLGSVNEDDLRRTEVRPQPGRDPVPLDAAGSGQLVRILRQDKRPLRAAGDVGEHAQPVDRVLPPGVPFINSLEGGAADGVR